MSIIAHEYGHTLGENLSSGWEEMKAYAFEGFFMARYLGVGWPIDGNDPKSAHDIARNRVAQLNQLGVHNLEILSQLFNYGFGQFEPSDFSKHIGIKGRIKGKITRHSHN